VPTAYTGAVATPQKTIPGYTVTDLDNNNIGLIGCEYLKQGQWSSLQKLYLSSPDIT
jgi:hypothetical protein